MMIEFQGRIMLDADRFQENAQIWNTLRSAFLENGHTSTHNKHVENKCVFRNDVKVLPHVRGLTVC